MSERRRVPSDDPSAGPAARAGMTIREYENRVWDMAKHLVHPAFLYALVQVFGITRLTPHPVFQEPGAGGWRELALFLAGFLGAWAVFYSTMLRDSGFRSLAATVLVPLAVVGLAAGWAFLPSPEEMTAGQVLLASLLLAGPGPVGWGFTMRRWVVSRREAAHILRGDAHEGGDPEGVDG